MKTHRMILPTPIHVAALRSEVSMLLVRIDLRQQGFDSAQPSGAWCQLEPSGWAWWGQTQPDGRALRYQQGVQCPYAPGDLIACREPWATRPDLPVLARRVYRADYDEPADFPYGHIYDETTRWQPASRMPLAACRLWFRAQSVEACRVQDVTEEEARAMGFPTHCAEHTYRKVFRDPEERAAARINCFRVAWQEKRAHSLNDWAWKLKVERTER